MVHYLMPSIPVTFDNFEQVAAALNNLRNAVDLIYQGSLATSPIAGTDKSLIGETPAINDSIVLFPEYPGASLTASGSNNDGGSYGMTSDVYSSGYTYINYYEWKSSIASPLQSYDIFVQFKFLSTFKNFYELENSAIVIVLCTEEASITNNKIDITLQKNGSSLSSVSTNLISSGAGTWGTLSFDATNEVLQSIVAGDVLNIRLRLYSMNSKYSRVGPIALNIVR